MIIMKRIVLSLALVLMGIVGVSAMTMDQFMAKYASLEGIVDATQYAASTLEAEGISKATVLMGQVDPAIVEAVKADMASIPEENQVTTVTGEENVYMAICQQPVPEAGADMVNMLVVTIKDNALMIVSGVCNKSTLEKQVEEIPEQSKAEK